MRLLPRDLLREAAARSLSRPDPTPLNYGYNAGDVRYFQALARFLEEIDDCPLPPESLFLTAGSSQALELICTRFTSPGDCVLIEEPSYFLAYDIFRQHGLRLVGVPTDADGLIPEALDEAAREHKPRLVYCIPAFHNPASHTLSPKRRARLVDSSRTHEFLLVADEAYQMLDYAGAAQPSMATYAGRGHVITLGSFSKILAPGLRLGWLHTDETRLKHLRETAYIVSGGAVNHFTSALVRELMESGEARRFLEHLKAVYAERLDSLDLALGEHLPGARWQKPKGGFFFWVDAGPLGLDAGRLLEAAGSHKVRFKTGPQFSLNGDFAGHLRLAFTFYDAEELQDAAARLGAAARTLLS